MDSKIFIRLLIFLWASISSQAMDDQQIKDTYRRPALSDDLKKEILDELDRKEKLSDPDLLFIQAELILDDLPQAGRKDEGLALMIKAAELGNRDALYSLGWIYQNGEHGVPVDEKRAIEFYHKSHEKGNILGSIRLGDFYYYNRNTNKEYPSKAVYFYENVSGRGDSTGTVMLAECYLRGIGVKRDIEKARKLLELGSNQDGWGSTSAIDMLEDFENISDPNTDYWKHRGR